ncbi:hypothetical protein DPMN_127219 [Dreissena polymorpha]|uniref:Galectin n=1 Tax=Dreissena polymorpha TaxID=45954 RepID=A0A9D4H1M0_DREPO|nr:hypothetical protein DPMN_127219 [Dreissena polymorpha]
MTIGFETFPTITLQVRRSLSRIVWLRDLVDSKERRTRDPGLYNKCLRQLLRNSYLKHKTIEYVRNTIAAIVCQRERLMATFKGRKLARSGHVITARLTVQDCARGNTRERSPSRPSEENVKECTSLPINVETEMRVFSKAFKKTSFLVIQLCYNHGVVFQKHLNKQLAVMANIIRNPSTPGTTEKHHAGFLISLQCGGSTDPRSDCALAFNPRFNENQVVRNSLQSGSWGPEERQGGFPFRHGASVDVSIVIHAGHYTVKVDGRHFCDYNHRIPLQRVSHISLEQGIRIREIVFEAPMGYPHPATGYPGVGPVGPILNPPTPFVSQHGVDLPGENDFHQWYPQCQTQQIQH